MDGCNLFPIQALLESCIGSSCNLRVNLWDCFSSPSSILLQNGAVLLLSMFATGSQPHALGAGPWSSLACAESKVADEQGEAVFSAARTFKYTWRKAKSLSCFGSGSWKPFDSGQLPGPWRSPRMVAQHCLGDVCWGMRTADQRCLIQPKTWTGYREQ